MKEILRYMRMKLQDVKGEVSVEWVLVAVIMAIIIVLAFSPTVQTMLTDAINRISAQVSSAT
jgi:Flp pilus assembly pilin Flp